MSSPTFVDHVQIYFTSGKGVMASWLGVVRSTCPRAAPRAAMAAVVATSSSKATCRCDLARLALPQVHQGAARSQWRGRPQKRQEGRDEILKVPLGTTVHNSETGEFIGEIVEHGQQLILVEGCHGGKGNWHFRSASNQVPTYAGPGGLPKELVAVLELKVLADVGLAGSPMQASPPCSL